MGLFEKRRCQKFLEAIQNFEEGNPKTYDGIKIDRPGREMLKKYDLEDNTVDFIGHAVALYTDDSFLSRPAIELIRKIQLYMDSMGKNPSPFIYPIFGLGGIPEGFSRISAVNGGTFMLNTDINEILFENGKVVGVKGPQGTAKCNTVICDPTYALRCGLKDRVKFVEKIIRCICILDHPIPGTENIPSVQIILPQRQLNRKNGNFLLIQTFTSWWFLQFTASAKRTIMWQSWAQQFRPTILKKKSRELFNWLETSKKSSSQSQNAMFPLPKLMTVSSFQKLSMPPLTLKVKLRMFSNSILKSQENNWTFRTYQKMLMSDTIESSFYLSL